MKSIKTVVISLVFSAGVLVTPIAPSEMTLLYSYQYPADQYQSIITLVDGHSTTTNPQVPMKDADGNNLISVSVFEGKDGELLYIQIEDDRYSDMGKREGQLRNPQKTELLNLIQLMQPEVAGAAIAYDTSASGNANPGSSVTVPMTVTGSNTLLLNGVVTNDTTDKVTGSTWNGTPLTRLDAQQAATTGFYGFIYYIVGAETGTHNLVTSRSDSNLIGSMAVSYTGVSQTGFPDSSAKGTDTSGDYTATTNVVASNSWFFVNTRSNDGDGAVAISVGVKRQNQFGGDFVMVTDSNGTVGTGAQSTTYTSSPGGEAYWLMCSFAPYVASVGEATSSTPFVNRGGAVRVNGGSIKNIQ